MPSEILRLATAEALMQRGLPEASVLLAVSALAYGVGRSAMAQQATLMILLPTLALVAAMLLRWWRHA